MAKAKKEVDGKYKLNADGYYRTSLTVTDGRGESRRVFLRAKSEPELDELVARTRFEIDRGELCFNSNMKFSRWAEEWLETYKKGNVSDGHYESYCLHLKNHIIPILGDLPLCDIRPVHCQKVLNQQAGRSKSLLTKLQLTMRQIFEQAIDNGYMVKSPARNLTMPTSTQGTHRPLTDFEREKVLELCEKHRAGLWILVMLYCGLRPSEAIALNWSDIDFERCFISVSHTMYGQSTKSKAGVRRVPAPTDLIKKLLEAKHNSSSTFVFSQVRDPMQPHTKTSMRQMWETFKRELDISMGAVVKRGQVIMSVVAHDLTPYCFRHTCATDYQVAGIPLNVAKVLLGHNDIKVTANIYTHYTTSDEANAFDRLKSFWSMPSVPLLCQLNDYPSEHLDYQAVSRMM